MELVIQNLDFLLKGAYYTLLITIVSMFFGLLIGLVVAVARLKGNKFVRNVARIYVSIIRGTPVLVQIFIIYYGLPDFGITLGPLNAAFISLSINISAYLSETFRGAILAVSSGQTEAAQSLGLTPWQTMWRVVLPQAARVAIPPMGNTFIGMLKETSLVSIVTVTELLRTAQLLIAQYYVAMPFFIAIAIMYWVMSLSFSAILNRIEARLSKAY
ncbi:ABC transporter permease [Paenibacillus sp. E194]|jgi:L-cystine transport system permease protein|uniref:Amino acid ABC transporter permease n=2 Tax=Paenibacillus alvei TaxID=44250 RepID=A0A383RF80_PAEAL|nr:MULTISPECIES: amino acid ABC transporter permease [Paenibacillus]EPY04443.1 amino acid ABC transporter permease [Paenibacillus alvei TS-15]KJB89244.1 ABC transporter permease [Paenibacillus sp. E194]MCM3293858.1 amino acid ABC transporter permease [Paenibacillus sp. MER 180]MCY9532792.1 amino acid ABC transporter permease [Paenibacillus alvei]OBY77464.1 ABC transporter permease [Paenibacillus sp. KS1]